MPCIHYMAQGLALEKQPLEMCYSMYFERGSNMTSTEKYLHIFFQFIAWIFVTQSIWLGNLIGASIQVVFFCFFPLLIFLLEKFYPRKRFSWWIVLLFALLHFIVYWLFFIFGSYDYYINMNSLATEPIYKSFSDFLTSSYPTYYLIYYSVSILLYPFVNLYSALLRFKYRKEM